METFTAASCPPLANVGGMINTWEASPPSYRQRLISSQREAAERAETTRGPGFVSRGKTLRAKPSVDRTTKARGNCKRLRRRLGLVLFSWESCKYIYWGASDSMCLFLLPLRCPAVVVARQQKFVAFSLRSMLFCNKLKLWWLRGFGCELS